MIGVLIHLPLVNYSPFAIRYSGLLTPWHAVPGENKGIVHCTRLKCYRISGADLSFCHPIFLSFTPVAMEHLSPVLLSPWRSQLRLSPWRSQLRLPHAHFTLSLVSPGSIPGGPRLARYRPADTPSGFPWVYPRGTTTGPLPTRRHSLWFPLGISQGDHNWPATDPPTLPLVSPGYIPGGPQLARYRHRRHSLWFPLGTSQGDHNWPATDTGDTPSGFPWVHPRGTTTGPLPTRRHSLWFPLGTSQGDHNWPATDTGDTPSRFPLGISQGDHNWPATDPATLPLVSPGYIPGGPQLARYRHRRHSLWFPLGTSQGDHNWPATDTGDTPSGFPWVYPRGTTTGPLPTRRHSLWFPLGISQGDHNWPATTNRLHAGERPSPAATITPALCRGRHATASGVPAA